MSEYTYEENPAEEDSLKSFLRGLDLQICLMRVMRNQLEACIKAGECAKSTLHEPETHYGKAGYMADVEINDNGEIATIRYDWVEP